MDKSKNSKDQSLYALLDKTDNSFFIGYCDAKYVYDSYHKHFQLKYEKTKKWIENIKNKNKKPCIFILETFLGSREECYTLSLIWTRIFIENNFKSIETESVLSDVNNIYDDNLEKYFNRKEINLNELLDCKNCIQPSYGTIKCNKYIGNNLLKLKATPHKKKRIEISLSEDEYEIIREKAEEADMKINRYIKEAAIDGEVKRINFEEINCLIKEVNKLYKLLNAYLITLVMTGQYYPLELDDIQKSIDNLKKNQKKIIRLFNKQVMLLIAKRTSKKS